MGAQFTLDTEVLRQQQRVIVRALSAYLPAAVIMLGLTAWVAGDGAWPAIVVGVCAVQVCYFAFVCAFQAIATRRMLHRAGTAAGRLTLTGSGADDGQRAWAWADVQRVRAYRTSVPHLRVYLTGPLPRLRRRVVACRSTIYGVGLDELIAAFEPFTAVTDPDRPLAPARDADGTTTFFFNHWQLTARRRRNLRSCWQVPLMTLPAAAGLSLAGYWPVGLALLVPAVVLIAVTARRVRAMDRMLGLGKNGRGRLLLTPGNLTLAGTDVPIPWSHVQDAALVRGDEPRVTGVITCPALQNGSGRHGGSPHQDSSPYHNSSPDHNSSPHHNSSPDDNTGRCRFADRRISFSIGARMYATTIDDVAAAFGEHVPVAAHD